MPLPDYINGIEYGDGFDFEEFKTKVLDEYNADLDIPRAKIDELNAATVERDAAIQALKIRNYDLMTSNPAVPSPVSGGQSDGDDTDETEIDIDDLFEESK